MGGRQPACPPPHPASASALRSLPAPACLATGAECQQGPVAGPPGNLCSCGCGHLQWPRPKRLHVWVSAGRGMPLPLSGPALWHLEEPQWLWAWNSEPGDARAVGRPLPKGRKRSSGLWSPQGTDWWAGPRAKLILRTWSSLAPGFHPGGPGGRERSLGRGKHLIAWAVCCVCVPLTPLHLLQYLRPCQGAFLGRNFSPILT